MGCFSPLFSRRSVRIFFCKVGSRFFFSVRSDPGFFSVRSDSGKPSRGRITVLYIEKSVAARLMMMVLYSYLQNSGVEDSDSYLNYEALNPVKDHFPTSVILFL